MIWKILFFIYLILQSALVILVPRSAMLGVEVPVAEAVVNTFVEIILVLSLIYTFALGWKKRLINDKFNTIFFYFSFVALIAVCIYLFVQQYTPMYADLLMHGMKTGMVPRHWDFQFMLHLTRAEVILFVVLMAFVIFAPFYLGYYHYTKQMTKLGVAKHSGRKCFAAYVCLSYVLMFYSMFLGLSSEIFSFNIFDCLSLVSSCVIVAGVYGYAFECEILAPAFWRVMLPVCVVIELLPASFFSSDYLNAIGWLTTQASPIYMLSSYLTTAIALVMIYRYATTDVVFKSVDD